MVEIFSECNIENFYRTFLIKCIECLALKMDYFSIVDCLFNYILCLKSVLIKVLNFNSGGDHFK